MANDLEAATVKQCSILYRCEARVVEGLVFERESACGLAMLGSGVEHQDRVVICVRVKHRKHLSLSLVRKVKVAIPGEDAIKAPIECQETHVGNDPFLIRQPV